MKKKAKKLLTWFYENTDRGEDNVANCSNLYELVERMQYRMEGLENEHLMLLKEMNRIKRSLREANIEIKED